MKYNMLATNKRTEAKFQSNSPEKEAEIAVGQKE
jgi:hypothetical protein